MDKKELVAVARQKALKKAAAYQRLFKSPDGKVVLDDLGDEFDRELHVLGDSHATHVRVGNIQVLRYIYKVMEVETDA